MADSLFGLNFGNPLWWPIGAPALSNFDIDNAADQWECIFQAREAIALARLGIRFNSITGTSPDFKISLQGVDATGIPDGTIKGGGSPASKVFNPTGLSWAAGLNWLTLDNPYTTTRGEWLALVVAYESGTIDASNKMQLSVTVHPSHQRIPYSIQNNAGVRTRNSSSGSPIFGYGTSGKAYGAPFNTVANRVYNLTTNPGEYAMKWTLPTAYGETYKVAGFRIVATLPVSQSHTFRLYDSDGSTVLQDVTHDPDFSNAGGTTGLQMLWFDETNLATLTTGTAYRLGIVTGSTNNVTVPYMLVDSAADWEAHPGSTNVLQSSRPTGGVWTDITTGRFLCELLITDLTPPAVTPAGGLAVLTGGGLAR